MSNIYRESRRMYFILFIHRKYVVGELELPSRTCICTYTVNYLRNQINKRTSVATTSTIRLHGDYGPKFSWRKSMTYKLQHKFVFIKFCLDKLKAHIYPISYLQFLVRNEMRRAQRMKFFVSSSYLSACTPIISNAEMRERE